MPDLKTIFTDPFNGIDLNTLIGEAIEQNADQINDINFQQLDRGLDAKGNSLGRYKNFKYKNRFQPVDLLKTGEFRRKFTITAGKKAAEMFSQDEKEDKLVEKYGKDIHGIAAPQRPNVEEIIKPVLQTLFENKIKRQ